MLERVVIANEIPFTETQTDPFRSLGNVLAFDSRDWAANRGDAWLWGIIFGWGDAMAEVALRHGWSEREVRRLRLLHLSFRRAEVHATTDSGEQA